MIQELGLAQEGSQITPARTHACGIKSPKGADNGTVDVQDLFQ